MNVGSWLGLEQHDPVAKELGVLYDLFLAHGGVVQAEWRYFLREFEQRRGHDDLRAMRDLARQRRLTKTKADNLPLKAAQHIDFVLSALETARERVEQLEPLEEQCKVWQEEEIKKFHEDLERETAAFEADMAKQREEIDRKFAEKKKELEEHYAVDQEALEKILKRTESQKEQQKEQKWFGKRLL